MIDTVQRSPVFNLNFIGGENVNGYLFRLLYLKLQTSLILVKKHFAAVQNTTINYDL